MKSQENIFFADFASVFYRDKCAVVDTGYLCIITRPLPDVDVKSDKQPSSRTFSLLLYCLFLLFSSFGGVSKLLRIVPDVPDAQQDRNNAALRPAELRYSGRENTGKYFESLVVRINGRFLSSLAL